jgi:hypothetical protein
MAGFAEEEAEDEDEQEDPPDGDEAGQMRLGAAG